MSTSIRKWVDGPGKLLTDRGRLHTIDRYLTEEEHDLALNAADFIGALHYRPIGSSGLLVRAAALRKPVLATDFGWIGWATNKFELGRTVNIEDFSSYSTGLTTMFSSQPILHAHKAQLFARYHTQDNQRAHILDSTFAYRTTEFNEAMLYWSEVCK
jgi:hypothetical protein